MGKEKQKSKNGPQKNRGKMWLIICSNLRRFAPTDVTKWPWNQWPDVAGMGGRMVWNAKKNVVIFRGALKGGKISHVYASMAEWWNVTNQVRCANRYARVATLRHPASDRSTPNLV